MAFLIGVPTKAFAAGVTCQEAGPNGSSLVKNSGDRVFLVPEILIQSGSKAFILFEGQESSITTEADGLHVRTDRNVEKVFPIDSKVIPRVNVCIAQTDAELPAFLVGRIPAYTVP